MELFGFGNKENYVDKKRDALNKFFASILLGATKEKMEEPIEFAMYCTLLGRYRDSRVLSHKPYYLSFKEQGMDMLNSFIHCEIEPFVAMLSIHKREVVAKYFIDYLMYIEGDAKKLEDVQNLQQIINEVCLASDISMWVLAKQTDKAWFSLLYKTTYFTLIRRMTGQNDNC